MIEPHRLKNIVHLFPLSCLQKGSTILLKLSHLLKFLQPPFFMRQFKTSMLFEYGLIPLP